MSGSFDAGWLALREPFDAAARSVALAQRLSAALPARPRLLDLGAGTGSLFRWLAPVIGRAQAWTFADADPALLDQAFAQCAAWGADRGFAVTAPGRALLLHSPDGAWRIEAVQADLAALPRGLPFGDIDAVVCSALLDLGSRAWLARLCVALRVPFLTCLNVDGRDLLLPRHPGDRIVLGAFRRDQQSAKGLGRALGPRAPAVLHAALTARGFAAASAPSDWRIPRSAAAMLDALVHAHADVALRQAPLQRSAVEAWRADRLQQRRAAQLAIRVGHRDSLALPPGVAA